MNKNFVAPAWGLFMFSLFFLCTYLIRMTVKYHMPLYLMGMWDIFFSFILWPGMMWVEAFFYWRVRTRNIYRRQSWAHVILFAFFVSTTFIRDFLFWLYITFGVRGMDAATYVQIVNVCQGITAWGAFLTGHVFFVRVLVKSSRNRPVAAEAGDSVNLLDDVLN